MRLTYFSWDGPGARYMRSLYLPILARMPCAVELVQVSYGEEEEVAATATMARNLGVTYVGRHFHRGKTRNATLAAGASLILAEARRIVWRTDAVVMARSVIPSAALLSVGIPKSRFIFDADGLVADERVDFAGWSPSSLPYRGMRWVERRALGRAGVTLTRTQAACDVLSLRAPPGSGPILVAPNGSDEQLFAPLTREARQAGRARLGLRDEDLLVVYCGSLGPQYRPDLMALFVRTLRSRFSPRRVVFSVLSADLDGARALASQLADTVVESVAPSEVPSRLGLADVALALRSPTFSQRAVSPIKVGEYLLCDVPVVANAGVGDLEQVLSDRCGFLLSTLTPDSVQSAAWHMAFDAVKPGEARAVGLAHCGATQAARGYAQALTTLAQDAPRT